MTETPSERLAEIIVKRLIQEKLILETDSERLLASLAVGKVNQSDWHLFIEKAIEKGENP